MALIPQWLRALISWPFTALIRFYQKFISPHIPQSCLYHPGCSTYTLVSIKRFGVIIGLLNGFFRLFRCNGWLFTGGEDPVPLKFSIKGMLRGYRDFWKYRRR